MSPEVPPGSRLVLLLHHPPVAGDGGNTRLGCRQERNPEITGVTVLPYKGTRTLLPCFSLPSILATRPGLVTNRSPFNELKRPGFKEGDLLPNQRKSKVQDTRETL